MLKIFLKKDVYWRCKSTDVSALLPTFGCKRPREITCSPQRCAVLKLFVRSKIYIFNIYPKRIGEAVAYERLTQSEVQLYTEISKFK